MTVEEPWAQRPVRLATAVAVLVFCVALIAVMAMMVLNRIDNFSTASSDNLQWTLGQVDVEFLQFELALARADASLEAAAEIRRRFDILYSRIVTLEQGAVFHSLRDDPDFETNRARVMAFLEARIALIDGPDAQLLAAVPALIAETDALAADIRALSLTGLAAFARFSDAQRQEVVQTLLQLSLVLAVLFAGLVLLALTLFRLRRLALERTRAVQRSAARLGAVVDTALDAIVASDEEGRIREFNPAARRIFGYSRDEVLGRNAIDLLFPLELGATLRRELPDLLENDHTTPRSRQIETMAVDKAGRRFAAEVSLAQAETEGPDGSGQIYVAYIRDISRRKAAEDALTEARDRALAGEHAKAEFLAVMSHEMRTPLNGLLGSMQLMRDHRLTERQSELLDRMESSGRQLLGLVNDVLDLSKFEAGKMKAEAQPFSFARLLDGVVETTAPLAQASGNQLGWRWIGPPAEGAVGDARRLRQVLLNLVGNALKFTHDGRVDIEVELLEPDRAIAEFRVIDTGVGIAAEDLERIFNDFETLDSSYARAVGGTGLGLGISRRLAELMGGDIGAESEPGEGSLFWLRVPLLPQERLATVPDLPEAAPARPDRPLRVLLVEDNEINRFVAREMLEAEGHEVVEALDGRSGVERAAAEPFDVILMDISMPVMDGPEAARRIRDGQGASARAPIVAVTAHALPEEVTRFREAGMSQYISKPIDRDRLRAVLAAAIDSGPDPAGPPTSEALLLCSQLDGMRARIPPASFAAIYAQFLDETDAAIAKLVADGTAPDAEQRLVHSCAGSCGTFGLRALHGRLAEVETRLKRGERPTQAEREELAEIWRRSRAALEDWQLGRS